MFNIQVLNNISESGLALFGNDCYQLGSDVESPQAILLRSADLHSIQIPSSVLVIGRAGAGTNNIPVAQCTKLGIPVLNTPGANANAVKELVITAMLLASRHIYSAWSYIQQLTGTEVEQQQQVEKNKKQFVGMELPGKTLAVIGLGNVGVEVANAAYYLGMEVVGYDPCISIDNAWKCHANVTQASSLEQAITNADFISLHVPLLDQTRHMINDALLSKLKPGVVLLNFARAELVCQAALQSALDSNLIGCYICDFPQPELNQDNRVICFPHLGASTIEAQQNCAKMIVRQVKLYLETGQIQHAVNFPDVKLPATSHSRLAIVNENIPNMVAQISTVLSKHNINIVEMINQSKEEIAYTLVDIDLNGNTNIIQQLLDIPGVHQVRLVG